MIFSQFVETLNNIRIDLPIVQSIMALSKM